MGEPSRRTIFLLAIIICPGMFLGLWATQPDPAQAQMLGTNQLLAKMLWGYPNFKVHEFRFSDAAFDGDSVLVWPWQARAIQFSASAYCSIKVYGAVYDDSTGVLTDMYNVESGVDTTWQRVKAGETHTLPVRCDSLRVGGPSAGLCRVRAFRD